MKTAILIFVVILNISVLLLYTVGMVDDVRPTQQAPAPVEARDRDADVEKAQVAVKSEEAAEKEAEKTPAEKKGSGKKAAKREKDYKETLDPKDTAKEVAEFFDSINPRQAGAAAASEFLPHAGRNQRRHRILAAPHPPNLQLPVVSQERP